MKGKVLNLGKNFKKKGGEFETMLKRYFTILIAVCIVGTIATISYGQAKDDDAFIVSISPTISYSVKIDSPNAGNGMVFTGMNLDQIAISTGTSDVADLWPSTATVYNDGNSVSDWKIQAFELDEWDLTPRNESNTFDTVAKDTACISAILTVPSVSADVINDIDFQSVVTTSATVVDIHERNMDTGSFVTTQGGMTSGDNVPKTSGNVRILWVRVHTPNDSTYATQQRFRIVISCWAAGTFGQF